MVHGVPSCGSCPLTFDGYCLHPGAPDDPRLDIDDVARGETHLLCPLRTSPLTLRYDPMGMGSASRGADT